MALLLGPTARQIAGQVFGKLVALEPVARHKDGSIIWRCECACGEIVDRRIRGLVKGESTNCGCELTDAQRAVLAKAVRTRSTKAAERRQAAPKIITGQPVPTRMGTKVVRIDGVTKHRMDTMFDTSSQPGPSRMRYPDLLVTAWPPAREAA